MDMFIRGGFNGSLIRLSISNTQKMRDIGATGPVVLLSANPDTGTYSVDPKNGTPMRDVTAHWPRIRDH